MAVTDDCGLLRNDMAVEKLWLLDMPLLAVMGRQALLSGEVFTLALLLQLKLDEGTKEEAASFRVEEKKAP